MAQRPHRVVSGAAGGIEHSRQRRCRRVGTRAATGAAVLLGLTALLSACTGGAGAPDPEETAPAPQAADTAPQEGTPDPALAGTCGEFWGDPEYTDPLSRVVLDRAATAQGSGGSDPYFYAMTGDDIDATFEGAPAGAQEAATGLADWFRSEPEQGEDADLAAFESAWDGLAAACADVSAAAVWTVEPGADGTKPATLVCADVFDTPGTLTHFANANVLTSNMFKLVGLGGRSVPADRMDDVRATDDLLASQIAAVDDDAVRSALDQVRAPFQDALEGETRSDGLREPLGELGSACTAAGYAAPHDLGTPDEDADSDEDAEGLV